MFLCISLCYFATLFMCIINAKVFAQYIFSVSVGFFFCCLKFSISNMFTRKMGKITTTKQLELETKSNRIMENKTQKEAKKKFLLLLGHINICIYKDQ